jgi:hypothetical protein
MVDIARLYHPAYSNDPRILAWCAALPEVSDCSSASVTPASAQWCCRSRVKAQIDPRSCSPTPPVATTARRAGSARALHFGTSSTCPRSASPNGPLLAGGSSPADSRGPSACCRSATGRRVLGADPSKRPSARRPPRLAGEPAHRSATRPGRHRTPPHTRAAACPPQRPDCSPRGIRGRPHAVTSAVTIDILLRPTATEPDRHETAWRSPCPAPTATPGPHCPTPTCQAPTSRGCRRHRDDRDHRRPTRPCRRR